MGTPARTPIRRTQAERTETTRAALLDATVELILRDRNADVRLAEVAERAGVTKGALQHHFRSKQELLAAVVVAGWGDAIERLDAVDASTDTVGTRIARLIDTMWESYVQPTTQAAYVVASTSSELDTALRSHHAETYRTAGATLDARWRAALADTGVSEATLTDARRFARVHLVGMIAHRHVDPGTPRPEDDLVLVTRAVVAMLGVAA